MTVDWNQTARDYPTDKRLHQLVAEQVARSPDAVAVEFEGEQMSFAALDRRANHLAHVLVQRGVGPDVAVGICTERSLEMVIGLLGILKAGGAYLPLDPAYPRSRLAFMLAEARAPVVLAQHGLADVLPEHDGETVFLDTAREIDHLPDDPPAVNVAPDHLAYVIYTSGSTGRPKGVMNTHRAICNHLRWMQEAYALTPNDRVLQKTPFSFDVSVFEFFWPLITGARLIIARPGGHREPAYLAHTIAAHGVTTLHFVPSMLRAFLEAPNLDSIGCLKRVLCSGEALPPDLRDAFLRRIDAELHNLYGPTEAAVDVTAYRCDERPQDATVPIGRPVANTTTYILDAQLQPVRIDTAGELFIGGVQLARGYLGRPSLTAERFVPDPFGSPGGRLYRTGDLARYQPDGNIEFLGRNDDQVKIRGFRIELGEIEASLVAHPDVRAAAVVVHERAGGDKRLVGYVTAAPATTPDPAALRRGLEQSLPAHMVPSAIVVLDALPLTPNGKLDRRRLAEIAPADRDDDEPLVPPRNRAESIIADAFAEVLGVATVGIHDDFADVGGHSLVAAQLIARIRDRCGIELLVSTIFEHPTVAALAVVVERAQRTGGEHRTTPLEAVSRERGELPLSFGQQRLWFLDQVGAGNAYNLFRGWRFRGQLDRPAMALALRDLVDRHESLRTRFRVIDGQPVQVVDPTGQTELRHVDLRTRSESEARAEADQRVGDEIRTPFDLARGPVFRATLVSVRDNEHWLLLGMHHIVSDGWSLDVLHRDLVALYEGRVIGAAAALPALPIQCADYAAWDRSRMQDAAGETSLAYWRAKLADLPVLDLPTDFRRGSEPTREGGAVEFVVPDAVVARLRTVTRRESVTTAMVMQAVYTTLLHRHTNQDDVVIGAAVANRNRGEFENLIGFFVDSVVMRTEHGGDPTFAELLGRTRAVALGAYDHQDIPFERLVDELQPHRDLGRNPLFQVLFTMESAPPPTMAPGNMPNGLTMEAIDPETTTARFDLALYVFESPEGLSGRFVYDTKLFRPATVERMTGHFLNLLAAATADPATRLSALPLMTDDERRRALASWNAPDLRSETSEPAGGFDLLAMVDESCDRFRDEPAIRVGSRAIAYSELDQASWRIAAALRARALPAGGTVAVCLRDRAQIIAAMLGIWRAGGVFVPLDPDGPEARLHGIFESVRIACVLVEEQDIARLEPRTGGAASPSMIAFAPNDDAGWCRGTLQPAGRALDTFDAHRQPVAVDPNAMSYVYHTSGSTGRPKGIAGTLRGLAHFVRWEIDTFDVGPGTQVSQLIVPTFDPFFRDVLVPLCAGGTVCVPPADVRLDPPALLAWIDEHRVRLVHSGPSFFSLLADAAHDPAGLRSLEYILLAGEALPVDLVRNWMRVFGTRITLVNVYGPSESTMAKLYHVVEPADVARRFIPIGRTIPGSRATLIDAAGNLTATGTVGELVIRSPYLTRGYFNDPEQTRQRFVPNPLSDDANDVVYRTGDLVRQLDDRSFQFVGRVDNQVKIRGIRIELEEIESALRAEQAVRDAVVVCREDDPGTKRLVAYVVGKSGSSPLRDQLRERLQRTLPDSMMPSAFVLLDALPLNPNGKVDRRALPVPDRATTTAVGFVAPRTPTEETLAKIWSDVLRVERVGVLDNFFSDLGGHSLLSIQAVYRTKDAFRIELNLQQLFDTPTVAAMAKAVELAPHRDARDSTGPIEPAPRDRGDLMLSFGQQRLWFLDQVGAGNAYNMFRGWRLHGTLDTAAMVRAIRDLVDRHESLRTRFSAVDGQAVQIVDPVGRFAPRCIDLTARSEREAHDEAERHAAAVFQEPFDLEHGPVVRATLISVRPDEHWLLIGIHHIASDGWSLDILQRDLVSLYDAYATGRTPELPVLPIQYADFAAWQRKRLVDDALETSLAYWRETLADLPALDLPTDFPRHTDPTREGGAIDFDVPDAVVDRLHAVARREGVTTAMALQAVFTTLLHRHTGQSDVVIGAAIANRNRHEFENLVGFFVDSVVRRIDCGGNPTFAELLARTREVALGAYAHQDLPFERLVDDLQPHRELGRNPLFQVMFTMDSTRAPGDPPSGLTMDVLTPNTITARFDLALHASESPHGVSGRFVYDTKLLRPATVEQMVKHYLRLLEVVTEDADRPLDEIPMLEAMERQRLLVEWNDTGAVPRPRGILAQFVDHAHRVPDRIALLDDGGGMTYRALDERTDRLARHLRSLGVGAEDRVAILLERSPEMIVALLGVLRAGAAYVPLDPHSPADRLAYMLEDSGAKVVLTEGDFADDLPAGERRIVRLDGDWASAPIDDVPLPDVPLDRLAYVIYTSGSTGQSKGVEIEHAHLASYVAGVTPRLDLPDGTRYATVSTIAADLGNTAIFPALASGGSLLVVREDRIGDADAFAATMREHAIDCIKIVPSHLEALLGAAANPADVLPRLLLVLGGEACTWALIDRVERLAPGCAVMNHYGPTETTVGVLTHRIAPGDRERFPTGPPVGRPLGNARAYVLEAGGEPVPVGAIGELHIGGGSVARGYLDRPGLTADKFVRDPFVTEPDARMYRTGDLARFTPSGHILFMGRRDDQVKLRGFRVELGEIQAALERHADIGAAAIVARDEGDGVKRLVAYIAPARGVTPATTDVRAFLKSQLPDYMVPAALVVIDRIPLTPNGKVDRRALPAPETADTDRAEFVAARTKREQTLAAIWADVLRIDRIGINDNFFELGGDSILSIQVVARAREKGMHVLPRHVFEHQTIAALAAVAESEPPQIVAEQGPIVGDVPLTPIQRWFFDQETRLSSHVNLLALRRRVTPSQCEAAAQHLFEHHDGLRLRFHETDSGWRQEIGDPREHVRFTHEDLAALDEAGRREAIITRVDELQGSFVLEDGPALHVALFDLGETKPQRLLFVLHQPAIDGVSLRILLEDFERAYEQRTRGAAVRLAPKTTSFKTWANRLVEHAGSAAIRDELAYWSTLPSGDASVLPFDERASHGAVQSPAMVTVTLSEEETRRLLRQVPRAYNTRVDEVLLTALAQSLCARAGGTKVLVDVQRHGREALFDDVDLSRTIGWFASIHPMILEVDDPSDAIRSLKAVKEQVRAVPNCGVGHWLLRYLSPDESVRRQMASLPRAQVCFNYRGQFDQMLDEASLFARAPERVRPWEGWPHRLMINGEVTGGRLRLNWRFDERVDDRKTIERLSKRYTRTLLELIACCASSETRGLTPSDVPFARIDQAALDELTARYGPANIEDIYPLSPMQQGMVFHSLRDAGTGVYVQQKHLTLDGLDVETFREAWARVISRHGMLRTCIAGADTETPRQVVVRSLDLPWVEHDGRSLDDDERCERLTRFLDQDRSRDFELAEAPLMRMALIRVGERRWEFVWTHHHLLLDGWSVPRIWDDLFATYEALLQGIEPTRSAPVPYRAYIEWLERQDPDDFDAYWRRTLAGFTAPTALGIDLARGRRPDGVRDYDAISLALPAELTTSLRQVAARHRVTLNALMMGVWSVLLSRYSGTSDVLFGTVVSGRSPDIDGVESIVGLLINTQPTRVKVEPEAPFAAWLGPLQDRLVQQREHEHAPLWRAHQQSEVAADTPLFESLFVFENFPRQRVDPADGTIDIRRHPSIDRTGYPLTMVVIPSSELVARLIFDRNRFEHAAIERMSRHYRTLLEGVITDADRRLDEIPMLDEAEQADLIIARNRTDVRYGDELTVPELVHRAAMTHPNTVAVVFEESHLTYAQLEAGADRLARHLLGLSIGCGCRIGLCVDRSPDMLIGLLGVQKTGAAYVPLDPALPAERLRFMLEDAGVVAIVTTDAVSRRIPIVAEHEASLVLLDALHKSEAAPTEGSFPRVRPDDVAYVIYTSGSTGRPKGVEVLHRGVRNFLESMRREPGFGNDDVLLAVTTLSFDIAGLELLLPLIAGGRVVIAPASSVSDGSAIGGLLDEHGVTVMQATPATWQLLIQSGWRGREGLKMLCGGESLPRTLADDLLDRGAELWNMYGPTETTIWSATTRIHSGDEPISIGHPIGNTQLYVLDARMRLVPDGAVGELCIGGDGIARGYLNRPDLTADRFVVDPFHAAPGARLYKTGDLVRYDAAGRLRFLGRVDHQIKLRGVRIELGEIESVLGEHPAVAQAIAALWEQEPGDQRLIAYVVASEAGSEPDLADLERHVRERLPAFMVPSRVVLIEAIPLTANDKIDRRSLPAPDWQSQQRYVAPTSPLESKLVEIWQDILRVERVGIEDDFFGLGGHSILAARVLARVRHAIGIDLTMREIFLAPTVSKLAQRIELAMLEAIEQMPEQEITRHAAGLGEVT